MIFSLLKKYWKYILDALIIIGLIVAVFLLNPWNIFKGGLRTHATANNVTAIREIGELITAEYYGEAISTINQARLQLIYSDNVNARADSAFRKIKQDLLDLYLKSLQEKAFEKKDNIFSRVTEKIASLFVKSETDRIIKNNLNKSAIANDNLAKTVLEFYLATNQRTELNPEKDINDKQKTEILTILLNELAEKVEKLTQVELENYLKEGLPNYNNLIFSDYFYDKRKESFTNKEEKKKLSMIGRGWVKAGFKFNKLDDSNFFFDKDQGIVHLFGVHAEILNADINPWYMPEKKIPGFQIIEANNKVSFYDAVTVKKYCIEKLRKMALDAGILKQAEIQGKETLKSFIGLLTGVEIKEVYFHYDNFTVLSREILNDEFISYEESLMLDTLIEQQTDSIMKLEAEKTNYTANQKYKEVKIEQMKASVASLKKAFFEERGRYYNRMSSTVFRVTADSILTGEELREIEKQSWEMDETLFKRHSRNEVKNSLWYDHPLAFITEYNNAIDEILHKTKHFGNLETKSFKNKKDFKEFTSRITDSLEISITEYEETILFTYLDSLFQPEALGKLKYPINVAADWQKVLENKNNIHSVQKNKSDVTDTLFIGPAITTQIYMSTGLKNMPVFLDNNKVWRIRSTGLIKNEQKLFLEYCINYHKKNNEGFFTRTSSRFRKFVTSKGNTVSSIKTQVSRQ